MTTVDYRIGKFTKRKILNFFTVTYIYPVDLSRWRSFRDQPIAVILEVVIAMDDAYLEALTTLGETRLFERIDPSRSWEAPGAAANLVPASFGIDEAASEALRRTVSSFPPPSSSLSSAKGNASARLCAALLASRSAAVPMAAARAVAPGASYGALGAPHWGPLALAAREGRGAALDRDADNTAPAFSRAEAVELSVSARVAGSRALALDAYAAQCTGRPGRMWGAPRSAFDVERLEALTARADAHAALDSHFFHASNRSHLERNAESSQLWPSSPVPQAQAPANAGNPFSHDADALLASAALILEIRRCASGSGAPGGSVWAALDAARALRPAAARMRGRFAALRTALGAARAAAPEIAAGAALPIAAILVGGGGASSQQSSQQQPLKNL